MRPPTGTHHSFRWRHLALLSAAVMLTVSLETLPAGILPAMASEFGRSDSAIGTLVSVWGFTVILTSIPLVRAISHRDRRTVTAVCLGVTGLFSLATALAPTYGWAVATRILGGASHGVFWAIVVVYAAALAPPRFLAPGIALVTGGSQLAAAVVIPAAAALAGHVSWRVLYAVLAALAVGVAALVRLTLPANLPAPVTGTAAAAGARAPGGGAARRGPLALAVVALFFVFAHFVLYTYATVYFALPGGTPNPHLGAYLAVIGVGSIIGLVASGPLANRWPRYGLVVYLVIFAAGMMLLTTGGTGARLTALALWGVMFGVIGPASQALALRFSPENFRPTISAVMVVTFNLGISLGAFSGGIIADSAGVYLNPFVAAGALALAAGIALWAAPRLEESRPELPRP